MCDFSRSAAATSSSVGCKQPPSDPWCPPGRQMVMSDDNSQCYCVADQYSVKLHCIDKSAAPPDIRPTGGNSYYGENTGVYVTRAHRRIDS